MVTDPDSDLVASLETVWRQTVDEIERLESDVADLQTELSRLYEYRAATQLMLRKQGIEKTIASPSGVVKDAPGPTQLAIELAQEQGGSLRVTELTDRLLRVGRYSGRTDAYTTAYATLRSSQRFTRIGRGRFRDEMYEAPRAGGSPS